ncbi:hypothetical protein SAMD00019534_073490 [Acytostelium subglobosum LB1]|uniref:hypothetical protein n=1 Tax=Acytostelium subglobosum LB1 TaxID=1410327 RepID=UPI000644D65C|nr:hypothetical protein SAMD00019534_073490 [Acytostelium subglobosum LB1]GAM24174.1 hypothetical protein SAMD00019534_073490 [Acytostelium subglobosum LB1]|eukprot:XP_012753210.1 hypothetical protein SAMD00019534_073490 [Acytostelium subglobosum LB1]
MVDSLFDITLHLDNKYSLHQSQHITTIILQGVDDPKGDPVHSPIIKPSYPTQSLEHKKKSIQSLFQSLTARPNSNVTVAMRHVFAGQVAQLIENYSLDPQSIDSLDVNNLFPQTFQSMVEGFPINNQLKTLDLRVLGPTCCDKEEYDASFEKIEASLYCNELIERCPNIESLCIFDECGSQHTGYSNDVVGKPEEFFGMLDELPHLVSLSFKFQASCENDNREREDPLTDEDRQSFLAELISFIEQRPSFHTLALGCFLDIESDILDYLFTDDTCPVQHLTLRVSDSIELPALQRPINTLVLKQPYVRSEESWHQDMAMVVHLKTMVNNKLDLSGCSFKQPATTGCELDYDFRFGSFNGLQYIPPLIYSIYNFHRDKQIIAIKTNNQK